MNGCSNEIVAAVIERSENTLANSCHVDRCDLSEVTHRDSLHKRGAEAAGGELK